MAGILTMIVAVIIIAGGASGSSGDGTGGTLNKDAVPLLYRPWVMAAGQCPSVGPNVLTPVVIAAQIDAESGWNPNAVSPVGAQGISQFMPDTWASWGTNANSSEDTTTSAFDPADAIIAQGKYDCYLAGIVKSYVDSGDAAGDLTDLMLAAYNAGPAAVKAAHGIPRFAETQNYVHTIRSLFPKYAQSLVAGGGGAFGDKVVAAANSQLDVPYVWGGGNYTGPTDGGWDCSGLVMYAIAQASGGKTELPHSSEIQATMGTEVNRANMRPGDIIAFDLGNNGDYDHIGIYIGNNQVIHAPHTGDVVKVATLDEFSTHPWMIRRFG